MNRLLNRVITRVVKFVLENGTIAGHVGLAFEKKSSWPKRRTTRKTFECPLTQQGSS